MVIWQYRLGFCVGIFHSPAEGPLTLSYSSSPAVAAHTTHSQCQDLAQSTCKSFRQTLLPVLGSGWRERECSHFSSGLFWTHDDRCSAVRRVLQQESTQAQMPVAEGDEKSSHTLTQPGDPAVLWAVVQPGLQTRCLLVMCFCHEHHMKTCWKTHREQINVKATESSLLGICFHALSPNGSDCHSTKTLSARIQGGAEDVFGAVSLLWAAIAPSKLDVNPSHL